MRCVQSTIRGALSSDPRPVELGAGKGEKHLVVWARWGGGGPELGAVGEGSSYGSCGGRGILGGQWREAMEVEPCWV